MNDRFPHGHIVEASLDKEKRLRKIELQENAAPQSSRCLIWNMAGFGALSLDAVNSSAIACDCTR
jgi:hypothetical protein